MQLHAREYGTSGPDVVLLHGGPGAPGYLAPVARELAGSFRVIEPFQRGSGHEPLTVARHVADLHELVEACFAEGRIGIVGHSWGAMLALAYAAAHPDSVACLALIGCGTFDATARERLEANRKERMGEDLLRRLERLEGEFSDPDQRLQAMGRLMQRVDSYELIPAKDETDRCDSRANEETWQDMLRLQTDGVYPSAFAAIHSPAWEAGGTGSRGSCQGQARGEAPGPARGIRRTLASWRLNDVNRVRG